MCLLLFSIDYDGIKPYKSFHCDIDFDLAVLEKRRGPRKVANFPGTLKFDL